MPGNIVKNKVGFNLQNHTSDLQSLRIQIDSISVDRDVNEEVNLQKNRVTEILGQHLEINEVYELNGSTYVTITTDESTVLTRVLLMADGNRIELEKTVTIDYDKLPDVGIRHTRTLHFPGTGEDLALLIERITFTESYHTTLEVTVN